MIDKVFIPIVFKLSVLPFVQYPVRCPTYSPTQQTIDIISMDIMFEEPYV
jgi:hypothetical protein